MYRNWEIYEQRAEILHEPNFGGFGKVMVPLNFIIVRDEILEVCVDLKYFARCRLLMIVDAVHYHRFGHRLVNI